MLHGVRHTLGCCVDEGMGGGGGGLSENAV